MIAIPLGGWLSKALGKRRYLTWTAVIFTFSSLLCSFSWNMTSMIVFRAMQGTVEGASVTRVHLVINLLPIQLNVLSVWHCLVLPQRLLRLLAQRLVATTRTSRGACFYQYSSRSITAITMIRYGLDDEKLDLGTLKSRLVWYRNHGVGLGCLEVVLEEGNVKAAFSSSFMNLLRYRLQWWILWLIRQTATQTLVGLRALCGMLSLRCLVSPI